MSPAIPTAMATSRHDAGDRKPTHQHHADGHEDHAQRRSRWAAAARRCRHAADEHEHRCQAPGDGVDQAQVGQPIRACEQPEVDQLERRRRQRRTARPPVPGASPASATRQQHDGADEHRDRRARRWCRSSGRAAGSRSRAGAPRSSANATASGGIRWAVAGDQRASDRRRLGTGTGSGSGSPRRPASTLRAAFSAIRSRVRSVADATWGTTRQLGISASGWSARIGSGSVTSRPAPQRCPERSASVSASWSTTGPREVLMSTAPGFIRASAAASMRCRVSALRLTWRLTKSLSREQGLQVDERGAELGLDLGRRSFSVVIQDAHPEAPRTPRDLPADAPEPDDAQRRARDVATQQQQRSPGHPAVVAHEGVGLGDAPRDRQQQREREVRGRLREHARRIAHRDAATRARGDIDVVVADREVADDLELRPGGVQQLVVDPVGQQCQQPVHTGHAAEQLVAWRRQDTVPDIHERDVAQQTQARLRDLARDQDPRLLGHAAATRGRRRPPRPASSRPIRSSASWMFSRELAYDTRMWSLPDPSERGPREDAARQPPAAAARRPGARQARAADVREGVERAVRHPARDARQGVQAIDQRATRRARNSFTMASTASCGPVSASTAGQLRERRGAADAVDDEPAEHRHQLRRHDRVAQAPAGHGVRLGEPIEHDGPLGHARQRGDRPELPVVLDAAVDLVREHDEVTLDGDVGDGPEVVGGEDRAARVVGAVDDQQPCPVGDEPAQLLDVDPEVALLAQRDGHRRGTREAGHRLVDGEARIGHDDLDTRLGQREHRVIHHGLGAGGHDHVRRVDREALPTHGVGRDRLPQLGHAERWAVVGEPAIESTLRRLAHVRRRIEVGLADLEVDDGPALCLQCAGPTRRLECRLRPDIPDPLAQPHGVDASSARQSSRDSASIRSKLASAACSSSVSPARIDALVGHVFGHHGVREVGSCGCQPDEHGPSVDGVGTSDDKAARCKPVDAVRGRAGADHWSTASGPRRRSPASRAGIAPGAPLACGRHLARLGHRGAVDDSGAARGPAARGLCLGHRTDGSRAGGTRANGQPGAGARVTRRMRPTCRAPPRAERAAAGCHLRRRCATIRPCATTPSMKPTTD